MARRGRFKTQAPKEATFIISLILWLAGLLSGLGVIHLPNSLGFWSLVLAGLLLLLGSKLDGI